MKKTDLVIPAGIIIYICLMIFAYMNGGSIEGWNYLNISVYCFAIILGCMYSIKLFDDGSKPSIAEKLERTERICSKCMMEGGKMKCKYYTTPNGVINKCLHSSNPEGI